MSEATLEQLMNDRSEWEVNEQTVAIGNRCDVCNKPMPVNMMTALFGVHYDCWIKENQ